MTLHNRPDRFDEGTRDVLTATSLLPSGEGGPLVAGEAPVDGVTKSAIPVDLCTDGTPPGSPP